MVIFGFRTISNVFYFGYNIITGFFENIYCKLFTQKVSESVSPEQIGSEISAESFDEITENLKDDKIDDVLHSNNIDYDLDEFLFKASEFKPEFEGINSNRFQFPEPIAKETMTLKELPEDNKPLVTELVDDGSIQNEASIDSIEIAELIYSTPLEVEVLAEATVSDTFVDELNENLEQILNVSKIEAESESFEVNSVIGGSKIEAHEDDMIAEVDNLYDVLESAQLLGDEADQDQINEFV